MGVIYGGNVGRGYLNAISNGSLTNNRLIMLNIGNESPTNVPPIIIAACLFLLVAQYVRSKSIAEGIQTGVTTKS